ncbi:MULTISPECIES: flagellar basal body-associated protein FliL [Ferrimonas]|uniref:flagellar basal body-associated protein FliL n=1 Tax=Ferrimonas TaxID=44011 RepID=UPI0004025F7E|nr:MULTISPECIES: flagellar basal body-associated protein FliL [Ferrimonas]
MRFANIMFILALVLCPSVHAEQAPAEEAEATDSYGYYGLEPEIVTNYVTESSRLGYIRVNIELMLEDASNVAIVEHHAPLIRSTIIEILGEQTEERIKSLTGREQIRRLCFETVNNMLEKEVGEPLLVNLLFTKFLYQ